MGDPARLSVYAAGYTFKYPNAEAEVRALLGENRGGEFATLDPEDPALKWRPGSIDFAAEARRKPPAKGVTSFEGFVQAIRAHKNLGVVELFAHGNSSAIYFQPGVPFEAFAVGHIKDADVSKSFAKGGVVRIFSCDSGHSPAFLQAIANKLRVRVIGYKAKVKWSVGYTGTSPNRRITGRGMDSSALPDEVVVNPQ